MFHFKKRTFLPSHTIFDSLTFMLMYKQRAAVYVFRFILFFFFFDLFVQSTAWNRSFVWVIGSRDGWSSFSATIYIMLRYACIHFTCSCVERRRDGFKNSCSWFLRWHWNLFCLAYCRGWQWHCKNERVSVFWFYRCLIALKFSSAGIFKWRHPLMIFILKEAKEVLSRFLKYFTNDSTPIFHNSKVASTTNWEFQDKDKRKKMQSLFSIRYFT